MEPKAGDVLDLKLDPVCLCMCGVCFGENKYNNIINLIILYSLHYILSLYFLSRQIF